jgi:hypothetical protein
VSHHSLIIFCAERFSNELMSIGQGLINNYETMQIISVRYFTKVTGHDMNMYAKFHIFSCVWIFK